MALDFYAGCLGGCAGVLVGHPFDTVKVRLQTQDRNAKMYRGTFHCFSTIIRQESFQGLYKGMSSPMGGLAVVNAIVFGVYGNIIRSTPSNSLQSQFLAGSAAGFVQSFVTSPMELAKTRMQLQGQQDRLKDFWKRNKIIYRNPLDCLKQVIKADGIRGFYKGLGCTILRDTPGFGVYFSGYEFLTKKIADPKGNVSTINLLAAGGMAGVMSWIVIYPFDVIKSRLQVDGMDGNKKYVGFLDCVKKSYKIEGLKVFTEGLNSTILRAFPTNAATFAVVTWVIMFCEGQTGTKLDLEKPNGLLMLQNEIQTI